MSRKLIGLSGHLETSAPGHFETFHKSLFEAFQENLGDDNCIFLGNEESSSSSDWFQALIPKSFTSTIPWLPKRFLKYLSKKIKDSDDKNILYVYEGNLSVLFLLGSILRKTSNSYLYFNFFNSAKHLSYLHSPIRIWIFRKLIGFATRNIESRIFLTVDTKRFGKVFEDRVGKKIEEFPMYSSIGEDTAGNNQSRTLINIRGSDAEKFLFFALRESKELQGIDLDIHGLHDEELVSELSRFMNCRLLADHVDYSAYSKSYIDYFRVAFLYDPNIFTFQSSGRLADAIMANAEIVVPRDTSLADVLSEYGNGSTFEFGSIRSFILAMTSEPSIPKRATYVPSGSRSAQIILESVESLEGRSTEHFRGEMRHVDLIFDETIRATLFLLRLLFGLTRRIRQNIFIRRDFK